MKKMSGSNVLHKLIPNPQQRDFFKFYLFFSSHLRSSTLLFSCYLVSLGKVGYLFYIFVCFGWGSYTTNWEELACVSWAIWYEATFYQRFRGQTLQQWPAKAWWCVNVIEPCVVVSSSLLLLLWLLYFYVSLYHLKSWKKWMQLMYLPPSFRIFKNSIQYG